MTAASKEDTEALSPRCTKVEKSGRRGTTSKGHGGDGQRGEEKQNAVSEAKRRCFKEEEVTQ